MSRKDAKYRSDGEGCGGWTGMGAVEMGGDEKIWRTKMNKKTKLTNN